MTSGKPPLVVQSILAKSDQLCALGRTEEACSILEYFLDAEGDNPLVLRCIARIKMAQYKPHEAVPLLKRALAIIEAKKEIQPQQPRQQNLPNTILDQDEERFLSDSDISFIEEISHEIKAKRRYFDWDDVIVSDHEMAPQLGMTSQISSSVWQNYQEKIVEDTQPSKEVENILDDLSNETILQEELFGLDDSDIVEELSESQAFEGIISVDRINLADSYEYAWEEFDPVGVEYDDDIIESGIFNQPADTRLTRVERAWQVAMELGTQYGWDEDGINILTTIFFKHGWSATLRSMRRELEAGITPDELSLAEQVREIWINYPEFSEGRYQTHGIAQIYLHLSWPNALYLIRSFGKYPDLAEIEKLLIDLYEHWRDRPSFIDAYGSFRHYLEYQIGRGRGSLKEPPGLSFESENYSSEECGGEQEYGPDNETEFRKELLALGVDLESLDIHRLDSYKNWDYSAFENAENQSTENENDTPNNKHLHGIAKNINEFHVGDKVKIISGRFKNYEGEIIGINLNKQKLSVLISFSCQLKEIKVRFYLLKHI